MILQVINFNLIEFVIAELWLLKIEDRVDSEDSEPGIQLEAG